ncbi:cysteine dioxygenase family protein [Paenibacillus sp. TAF58]
MALLRAIEQTFCNLQEPSLDQLKEALQSLSSLLHEVPVYQTEPTHLPYGRNVVYNTKDLEVIVIQIPVSEATAIHNHGTSIGSACLVKGTLVNTKYRLDSDGYPVAQTDDYIGSGEYFEAPCEQIHQLSNPFHEPAVSIHVYSPPLQGVTRYLPYSEILDYVI